MSQIFFPSQQKKTSQAILSAFQVLFAKLLGFINTIWVFNERPLFLDFWPFQKKIFSEFGKPNVGIFHQLFSD